MRFFLATGKAFIHGSRMKLASISTTFARSLTVLKLQRIEFFFAQMLALFVNASRKNWALETPGTSIGY